MSTLRVTLNTGETHDVEIKPETVVSFRTEIGTGDGRTLVELFAWCDIASIDALTETPNELDVTEMTRAELNDLAERNGISNPANPHAFPSKASLAEALIAHKGA